MHYQRGFTLFESLIVLAIGVAVIGGIMFIMQANARAERRDAAAAAQGLEMTMIAKAARQWADTEGESWANGSRNVVTIDALVDNGLLPEDFAARDVDERLPGVTPTGQRYTIVSIKNGPSGSLYYDPNVDEGKIRTVIWDEGDPLLGRLERIGVPNVVGAIMAFKESVGMWVTTKAPVPEPMGVLAPRLGEVRGVGRSFTKDVIDWIEDPLSQPAAVTLVGFPDLEGDDGGGGSTNPTGPYCDDIVFVDEADGCAGATSPTQCEARYAAPTCPSGYSQIASAQLCAASTSSTAPEIFAGEWGTVIMAREVERRSQPPSQVPYYYQCGPSTCTGFLACGGSEYTSIIGYAEYNGARVGNLQCLRQYTASQMQYSSQPFTPPRCVNATTDYSAHPTLGVAEARSLVCCRVRR